MIGVPLTTVMAAAAHNCSRRRSKQLILLATRKYIFYDRISIQDHEDLATPPTLSPHHIRSFQDQSANMSGPLAATFRWLQRKRYQYEVTFSLYMLTPTEKFIFSEISLDTSYLKGFERNAELRAQLLTSSQTPSSSSSSAWSSLHAPFTSHTT